MTIAAPTLRLNVEDSDRRLEVDLAAGRLRVTGPGLALEGTDFGLLQTATRWSSVTGLVYDPAAAAHAAFVLIADEMNGSVTLHVDGRPALAWKLRDAATPGRPASPRSSSAAEAADRGRVETPRDLQVAVTLIGP
jgi:hypothetical protein